MQHSCERTTYSVITRRLYLLRARNRKIVDIRSSNTVRPTTRSDKVVERRRERKKKKKRLDGATVVVINISEEEFFFFFSFSPNGANAAHGASSDARVVAGYQFNLFSMNGRRIGFLKVPVSLGEPHFLTPL